MARPFPAGVPPGRRAVRPDRRPAVHLVRREGRHPVRLGEDHQRLEARRQERMALRWEAELQVRVVA